MKKRLYSVSNKILPGFDNISIEQTPNLINSSIDHIYLDDINRYSLDDISKLLNICFLKLRHQGLLTIVFCNYRHICKAYIDGSMTDVELMAYIMKHNSIVSSSSLIDILNNLHANILEINQTSNNFITNIIAQRI